MRIFDVNLRAPFYSREVIEASLGLANVLKLNDQELPVLAGGAAAHPGVAFVGADNQDTASGFASFEKTHPHPYPAGPIVEGSYQSYGVAGLPVTFFIDAQGKVVASFGGPLDTPTLDHYLALMKT